MNPEPPGDYPRGRAYDQRFSALERAGHDIHGEASFVMAYHPDSVLDAGCGTGRVAIELDHRGVRVLGIDVDEAMLETAREKAPTLGFLRADLADFRLVDRNDDTRHFDVVVAAGNVMLFVDDGTEPAVVANMATPPDRDRSPDHRVSGHRRELRARGSRRAL